MQKTVRGEALQHLYLTLKWLHRVTGEGDRGIDRDQRVRARDKWGKETERGRGQERHRHGEAGKR